MKIRSKKELQEYVNRGKSAKYMFFWGHRSKGTDVTKASLSQWYGMHFSNNGISYMSAEHYMMAEKARLFGDRDAYQKIINASNPGAAKAFGREVRGFDEEIWARERFGIVVADNLLKFSQNKELAEFLIGTGQRVLVEASPVDRIWGIGLAADDHRVENPNLWRGENLLGFALMEVRDMLEKSE